MTNLLAQRKEMKRLEKLNERQKLEDEDQKLREEEEARLLAVAARELRAEFGGAQPAAAADGVPAIY